MGYRKVHKKLFWGWVALTIFIPLSFVYYILFASSQALLSDSILQLAVNQHDHDVYLMNMKWVQEGRTLFELANDKGIASIYLVLSELLPFLVAPDLALLSLVFNCLILILSYWIYGRISDEIGLGAVGRLSFFVNLSLLYFAQLINKDMLTILIFLLTAYAGMRRWHWWLVLLIPFVAFVRIQLVVFIVIFIFLSSTKKVGPRFWITYTVTSLLAAYMSVYFSIIGDDSLGGGFSAYLVSLNNQNLMGYLLFNPIRLLQYVFDAYLSFYFLTHDGTIDVAKVLRIPQLVLLALLAPYFLKVVFHWRSVSKSISKPLVLVFLAYACTWLMNPTINARYVMLITPILVLLGLYMRSVRRRA